MLYIAPFDAGRQRVRVWDRTGASFSPRGQRLEAYPDATRV